MSSGTTDKSLNLFYVFVSTTPSLGIQGKGDEKAENGTCGVFKVLNKKQLKNLKVG